MWQVTNGNFAIIFSYMSFSLQQHISLLNGEFSRRRKKPRFFSFGSLVGIRRPFWNAADDGGWQETFLCPLEFGIVPVWTSEIFFEYFWNIFGMQLMMVVDREVFVLARIWHHPGLNVCNISWIVLKYFGNAADGGGWQETFLCLLEFGIVPVWTFEIWLPRLIIRSTSKGESTNAPLTFFNFLFPKKNWIHLVMESRSDNGFALLKNHSRCDV